METSIYNWFSSLEVDVNTFSRSHRHHQNSWPKLLLRQSQPNEAHALSLKKHSLTERATSRMRVFMHTLLVVQKKTRQLYAALTKWICLTPSLTVFWEFVQRTKLIELTIALQRPRKINASFALPRDVMSFSVLCRPTNVQESSFSKWRRDPRFDGQRLNWTIF